MLATKSPTVLSWSTRRRQKLRLSMRIITRYDAAMGSPSQHLTVERLIDELVEAHLDTIELLLDGDPDVDDRSHVDYLRALVREAKTRTAAPS
jgi:hypothetical protein